MVKMLISSMNFWINTSSYIYALYWDTIKAIFSCDFKKFYYHLKIESVLQMMDNIGTLLPSVPAGSEDACCVHLLSKYYEPMVAFMHFCILSSPMRVQEDTAKLLSAIGRRPCHCMFIQLVRLVRALCESDAGYAKAFDGAKGLMTVFRATADYGMDAKVAALRLFSSLIDLSKRQKLALKVKGADLAKYAFAMFKDIRLYQRQEESPSNRGSAKRLGGEERRSTAKQVSPSKRSTGRARRTFSAKCLKLRVNNSTRPSGGNSSGSASGNGSKSGSGCTRKGRSLLEAVKKLHASGSSGGCSGEDSQGVEAKLAVSVQGEPLAADEGKYFQSPPAVKKVAKLYADAASVSLKFGGVSSHVGQLYNFLIFWALGADLSVFGNYNSPSLRNKIRFKELSLPTNPNLVILNGEPICILGYIAKKLGSAKLAERLVKDMRTLCQNRSENMKALLIQAYFMRQLIKLEYRLHYHLAVVQDGAIEKLAKRTTNLVTSLLCEGLRWTSSVSFMLKMVAFAAQIAEAEKAAPLMVFSTAISSQNLWTSILIDYAGCLSTHKPVNSQLAAWQNVPLVVVLSVKMLLALGLARDEEQKLWLEVVQKGGWTGKEGEMQRIADATFEIVQFMWTGELSFIAAATEPGELVRKKLVDAMGKGKASPLMQQAKILGVDVREEDSVHPKGGQRMGLLSALALLLATRIGKSQGTLELEYWTRRAGTVIRYMLTMAEFSRAVGESTTMKETLQSLSVVLSSVVKSAAAESRQPEKPDGGRYALLRRLLASTLQFLAVTATLPHSSTLEFYKKNFTTVSAPGGSKSLLVPVERLADKDFPTLAGKEIAAFFQGSQTMQKLAAGVDSADEEILGDCKNYAHVRCRNKADDRRKREADYKYCAILADRKCRQLNEETGKRAEKCAKTFQAEMLVRATAIEVKKRKWKARWEKVQRRLKQWVGCWRNTEMFAPERVRMLPMRLANHFFANGSRCVLRLRDRRAKYMDRKKYPQCFEEAPLAENFFVQLRCVTGVSSQAEAESAKFASSAALLQPIHPPPDLDAHFAATVSVLLYNQMSVATRDDLPAPVDCEIYTNLCAKRGKLMIYIRKSGGYLLFVGETMKPTHPDHRVTYDYASREGACTIKKWRLKDLKTVCRKWVVEARTAVEAEFFTGRSVMFNFFREQDAEIVCKKLVKMRETHCPGLRNDGYFDGPKILERTKLIEAWANRRCSTFDYLLSLNAYSSRSFNNLSQYPVFPWLLADYSSDTLTGLAPEKAFRDLSKNMGMAGNKARAEEFKEKFSRPDLTGQGHFNFGSHYSSPGIVFQYLMRVHPIFEAYVKFFSGLDIPNRMFHSIAESWTGALKDSGDVRELTPEFFCLPDMFLNRERLAFGEREDDHKKVDNIVLPPWAKGSPFVFVTEQRRALESEQVGQQLGRWIDLVFGCLQRGKEAEKAWNVFPPLCYEPAKVLAALTDADRVEYRLQAFDWGQTPQQLFARRHIDRRHENKPSAVCDSGAKLGLYCSKSAEEDAGSHPASRKSSRSNSKRNDTPTEDCAIYIKTFGGCTLNSHFIMVTFNGTVVEGSIAELAEHDPLATQAHPLPTAVGMITSGIVETTTKKYRSPYATDSKWRVLDPDLTHNFPVVILHNRNPPYIVQGGCIDGSVQLTSLAKGDKVVCRQVSGSAVMCLAVDPEERIILAGTKEGDCLVFESGDGMGLVQTDHLRDHKDAVVYVDASGGMNLFLTSSLDGTANLYSLSTQPQILRTFRHPAGRAFHCVSG